jgi:mannitol-1-/sugar-/sorbitol-6-/2-deoxyglucose-6-phosphatase
MPIQAVIYDMDGVLLDSERYWYESRIDFATDRGLAWTMEDQRAAMGRSTVEWAQVMRERLHLDMTVEAIMADVIARVNGRITARFPALPGAIESVHACAAVYPVALASGSPTQVIDRVLALTGLDALFQHVVYGDDMAHGKPAPDIYFETARRLGVDPAACVGIEDSANGVRALHNAGMQIIAVPSPGFTLPDDVLALAHRVLPSLEGFDVGVIREMG